MARTVSQRLLAKVSRDASGCWVWTAHIRSDGYGAIRVDGKTKLAHRVSYELHRGDVPDGVDLDHLCRVRACVNPDHLEAVSRRTNVLRGVAPSAMNATKTHCDSGHEFTSANTYVRSKGERQCRTCNRAAAQRYRGRKASA